MSEKNMTPHQLELSLLKDTVPALRYDGSIPFAQWQKQAREKLAALLGLPYEKPADHIIMEYDRMEPDFREIRFSIESEKGYFVPCHLLIPKDASAPLPVVICLQGHSRGMHVSLGRKRFSDETSDGGDRDFALQAVREGYCALVMEQRGFGECGGTPEGPDCYLTAMTSLLTGRTMIGGRVWDISRVIDALELHFPEADCSKIACMGNSGGGTATFYAACLEPRIKTAMPSCALCTFEGSIGAMFHCSCNYVPGIRKYFDMGDLGGLIAPRKLIAVCGREDEIFNINGAREAFAQIQKLYHAAGAADACAMIEGSGGHRFYAADAWPVFHRMFDDMQ